MADALDIIANPKFEPEQFFKNVVYLLQARPVIQTLLASFPELLMMEVDGRYLVEILLDVDELNIKVHRGLKSKYLRFDGSALVEKAIKKLPEEVSIDLIPSVNTTLQSIAAKNISSPESLRTFIDKYKSNDSKYIHWNAILCGIDPDVAGYELLDEMIHLADSQPLPSLSFRMANNTVEKILRVFPRDHDTLKKLVRRKLKLGHISDLLQIVKLVLRSDKLSEYEKLKLYVYHLTSRVIGAEDSCTLIRKFVQMPAKCLFCTKVIKSWPGMTMHLEKMHEIKRSWKEDEDAANL